MSEQEHEPYQAPLTAERLDRWVAAVLSVLDIDPAEVVEGAYLPSLIRRMPCHWGSNWGPGEDPTLPLCTEEDPYPADQRAELRDTHRTYDCVVEQWKEDVDRIRQLYAFAGLECTFEQIDFLFETYSDVEADDGTYHFSDANLLAHLCHRLGIGEEDRTVLVRDLVGDVQEITYRPAYGRDTLRNHLIGRPHRAGFFTDWTFTDPDLDSDRNYVLLTEMPDTDPTVFTVLRVPLLPYYPYHLHANGPSFQTVTYTDRTGRPQEIRHTLFFAFVISLAVDGAAVDNHAGCSIVFRYFPGSGHWLIQQHHEVVYNAPYDYDDIYEDTLHVGPLEEFVEGTWLAVPDEPPCLDYTRADLRGEWTTRVRALMRSFEFGAHHD